MSAASAGQALPITSRPTAGRGQAMLDLFDEVFGKV